MLNFVPNGGGGLLKSLKGKKRSEIATDTAIEFGLKLGR